MRLRKPISAVLITYLLITKTVICFGLSNFLEFTVVAE